MLQSRSPGMLWNTRVTSFVVSGERIRPERSKHLHNFPRSMQSLVQLWSSRRLLLTDPGVSCYGISPICCPRRDRSVSFILPSDPAMTFPLQHFIWSAMPRAQLAVKSYRSSSSSNWRTDPKYAVPPSGDATFKAGVFNTSPAWFQQGRHVSTTARLSPGPPLT